MTIQAPVWRIAQCPPARRKKARKARAMANRPRTPANDSVDRAVEQVKNGILKDSVEREVLVARPAIDFSKQFCAIPSQRLSASRMRCRRAGLPLFKYTTNEPA